MDVSQIITGSDLYGWLSLQAKQRIVAIHSKPIIHHAHQTGAASSNRDFNSGGSGIETIFDQLFDYRSRAFHDLTRGHLGGNLIRKQSDSPHRPESTMGSTTTTRGRDQRP